MEKTEKKIIEIAK
jgi:uncharacterized membrane protein